MYARESERVGDDGQCGHRPADGGAADLPQLGVRVQRQRALRRRRRRWRNADLHGDAARVVVERAGVAEHGVDRRDAYEVLRRALKAHAVVLAAELRTPHVLAGLRWHELAAVDAVVRGAVGVLAVVPHLHVSLGAIGRNDRHSRVVDRVHERRKVVLVAHNLAHQTDVDADLELVRAEARDNLDRRIVVDHQHAERVLLNRNRRVQHGAQMVRRRYSELVRALLRVLKRKVQRRNR